eukprot:TRINITY_DN211_c3_g1_i1.p1 TRINITY_DN211_c3_g1~~TRINITY_DN211_c3_g1_i1.p1  ORF type:complete len:1233 (+),score=411.14 TRINITY_DN211_c3_g1_i1:159-3701(+)
MSFLKNLGVGNNNTTTTNNNTSSSSSSSSSSNDNNGTNPLSDMFGRMGRSESVVKFNSLFKKDTNNTQNESQSQNDTYTSSSSSSSSSSLMDPQRERAFSEEESLHNVALSIAARDAHMEIETPQHALMDTQHDTSADQFASQDSQSASVPLSNAAETNSRDLKDSSPSVEAKDGLDFDLDYENAAQLAALTEEQLQAIIGDEFFMEKEVNGLEWIFDQRNIDPEVLNNPGQLADELERKDKLLKAVNNMLSDRVMNSYSDFVQGMAQVRELGDILRLARVLASNSRRSLLTTDRELTEQGFLVIKHSRKKEFLQEVVQHLTTIQHMMSTSDDLSSALSEADYPKAIELCLQSTKSFSSFKNIESVRDLMESVNQQYNLIETRMMQTLQQMCRRFDARSYKRILEAFRLIGKAHLIPGILQENYTEAITRNTRDIARSHAMLAIADAGIATEEINRMPFKSVCAYIPDESFQECLRSVLEGVYDVMENYYHMYAWISETQNLPDAEKQFGNSIKDLASVMTRFRADWWKHIQNEVSTVLESGNMAPYQIEEFLKVFNAINRFRNIGEQFSGTDSAMLQESIRRKSVDYFQNYHSQRVEDVSTMLANEMWHHMPMPAGFEFSDVKELKPYLGKNLKRKRRANKFASSTFLSSFEANSGMGSPGTPKGEQNQHSEFDSMSMSNMERSNMMKDVFSNTTNPFKDSLDTPEPESPSKEDNDNQPNGSDSEDDDNQAEDGEEINKELLQDFIDEEGTGSAASTTNASPSSSAGHNQSFADGFEETGSEGPIVTATTIQVLRYLGKYLNMMEVLEPIADDVFQSMCQLFELYMFCVFRMFGNSADGDNNGGNGGGSNSHSSSSNSGSNGHDGNGSENYTTGTYSELLNNPSISSNLRTTLTGIRDRMFRNRVDDQFSPLAYELEDEASLFGLTFRVTATESLVFLMDTLKQLQPAIEERIGRTETGTERKSIQALVQTMDQVQELRHLVYSTATNKYLNLEPLVQMIGNVNFAIKELDSESKYVELILRQLSEVNTSLASILITFQGSIKNLIWEHISLHLMGHLLEGFSKCKKCTNEGRALMSLDFQTICAGLQKYVSKRPLPGSQMVDDYIKAFYQPEEDVFLWCKNHSLTYSMTQLTNLVQCGVGQHMKRKAKNDLISGVEEAWKAVNEQSQRRSVIANFDTF